MAYCTLEIFTTMITPKVEVKFKEIPRLFRHFTLKRLFVQVIMSTLGT